METYKNYINEANYTRFLKLNKNLTAAQVKELNDYFSEENHQAGKKIQWQSKKIKNMSYEDFEKIMLGYASGFIKKMKVNIPGKKGEDYQQVNLNNKKFLANIPLNYETAKFLNSKKYGTVATGHCIGWEKGDDYWIDHVITEQKIPIYVIDATGKWVVMIKKDNRSYEVWNKANQRDSARDTDPIPGFNIKKELLTSGLKKLYNKLRENMRVNIDYNIAVDDYKELAGDIESYNNDLIYARKSYMEEMEEIKTNTIKDYEDLIEYIEEKENKKNDVVQNFKNRMEEIKKIISTEPTGTGTNKEGEIVWELHSIDYTLEELNDVFRFAKKEYESYVAKLDFSERDEYLEIVERIKGLNYYELSNPQFDDDIDKKIEWSYDPWDEEEITSDIWGPSVEDANYANYFLFVKYNFKLHDYDMQSLQEYIYEIESDSYNGSEIDGEEFLDECGWPHPKKAKNRRN